MESSFATVQTQACGAAHLLSGWESLISGRLGRQRILLRCHRGWGGPISAWIVVRNLQAWRRSFQRFDLPDFW